jgi:RNA polymerase sigma-70 factor (ECF subfamily)
MTYSALAERAIVQRAQSGDTQAFGELVLMHQTFVYNLALRLLGDSNEAQDLAQEAFLRAWQGLGGFRGAAGFRTWLYRIAMNLCYNRSPQLKQSLSHIPVDEHMEEWLPAETASPERELERAELRSFLHRQIERLPESYRLLVMLRYQQDLSYEEIAEVTGMPLGTVKTGLFRAHARLKAALQGATGSEPGPKAAPAGKGDPRPGGLSQPAAAVCVGGGGG